MCKISAVLPVSCDLAALALGREVNLAAVSANGIALQWSPERFRNDKEVALAAVQSAGQALKYVGRGLRGDRDVVAAAVQQNALALSFASKRLRKDKGLVLEACKANGQALLFAEHLREDSDCLLAASNSSWRSSCRARSRFAAMADGRWPCTERWSCEAFLAASSARAMGDAARTARQRSSFQGSFQSTR